MSLALAIKSLCPEAEFVLENEDYSTIRWIIEPSKMPSISELETEAQRLLTDQQSKEYQRLRKIEYPTIGDQLDALFHAGVFPPDMQAKIQAVKDKYPKGS